MPAVTLPAEARDAILRWFDARGRSFPFRGLADPYRILVLETMAQQTQIARASERWGAFVARFPTVEALAAASPADVLREWRGLGYNRRALNLWQAAQAIVREHGGRVPDDLESLVRLPGVGPYTARAVAACGYRRAVTPVDTNVRRVLGRLVAGDVPPSARELQAIADRAVPTERPGDWAHALMDLGATVCRPARPACPACPVLAWCVSAATASAPDHRPAGARVPRHRRPFTATARWLRGRLLDRLRDALGDGWVEIEAPIGSHDEAAVDAALRAMAAEGLIERDLGRPARARLRAA